MGSEHPGSSTQQQRRNTRPQEPRESSKPSVGTPPWHHRESARPANHCGIQCRRYTAGGHPTSRSDHAGKAACAGERSTGQRRATGRRDGCPFNPQNHGQRATQQSFFLLHRFDGRRLKFQLLPRRGCPDGFRQQWLRWDFPSTTGWEKAATTGRGSSSENLHVVGHAITITIEPNLDVEMVHCCNQKLPFFEELRVVLAHTELELNGDESPDCSPQSRRRELDVCLWDAG